MRKIFRVYLGVILFFLILAFLTDDLVRGKAGFFVVLFLGVPCFSLLLFSCDNIIRSILKRKYRIFLISSLVFLSGFLYVRYLAVINGLGLFSYFAMSGGDTKGSPFSIFFFPLDYIVAFKWLMFVIVIDFVIFFKKRTKE